ncbi:MAG: PQQ-binding-like beta-propeller repeat protein [Proteobacteria bacterium]|nr:PQQ-binding-like beta-propeller repeat protein [Pseudomonadota bacterium]
MPRPRLAFVLAAALLAAGCDSWFGEVKVPLPGERVSVLSAEKELKPDPGAGERSVRLPRPTPNPEWPQAGGYPDHAMHHIAIADAPRMVWRANIGSGSSTRQRLITPPVAAAGKVFAMDSGGNVSAFDIRDGRRLWRTETLPGDERDGLLGGGVAFNDGRVFVASGLAEVLALDAEKGEVRWRRSLLGPMRAPPTVIDGRLFVVTVDNQLFAVSAEDGSTLWSHRGISETASLLGAASPAADGEVVVAAYSSGELFAFRVENGRVLWSDSLAVGRRAGAGSALPDIRGLPVIDRGRVFAVNNSGLFVAIDLRSGQRLWERDIGGIETPWVAGDYVFLLANAGELVSLQRADGRILWVASLPGFEDPAKRKGPITWTGPVLASDRLIVAGSQGQALAVSPYTGRIMGSVRLPDGVATAPIIAGDTILFLTRDGELVAYR